MINLPPPEQNGRHFVDDIFRCVFVDEKFCILIKISLKFVPIDSKWALVQVMTECLLPEPILTQFYDAYMRHYGDMS